LSITKATYSLTVGGLPFTYLARSSKANLDFWEQLVSPNYKDGFYVQSWGRPYMEGYCPPSWTYTNLNIANLTLAKWYWEGYNDHSKWGIGVTTNTVCYADINRMYTQKYRGGGGLCVVSADLYKVHKAIATNEDPCGSTYIEKKLSNY